MEIAIESGKRLNLTATNAALSNVYLRGIFVASASATPTIKVADDNGTIVNTFTPVAASYYPIPCETRGTLTVTIGGTVDATVFYA